MGSPTLAPHPIPSHPYPIPSLAPSLPYVSPLVSLPLPSSLCITKSDLFPAYQLPACNTLPPVQRYFVAGLTTPGPFEPMRYHLTQKSNNIKTGPMPVTTTHAGTCPPACPMRAQGCYASAGGPLALHWRKVTEEGRGEGWQDFLASLGKTLAKRPIRQLWRHNQAGDLPGSGNRINRGQALQLAQVNAQHGARGWTYTHKPVEGSGYWASRNRETIRLMIAAGFAVNLSANNLAHADRLAALGIAPVAVVLPAATGGRKLQTPEGRPVVVCPATLPGSKVTCATCGLCAVNNLSRPIVGFPAHGPQRRKAEAACSEA